jgi:hypothetical protein
MTRADKLAAVIAVGVFILSRIFLSWFDSLTMRCAVSVCGADHLPLVGGLIGAAVFLIGYASLRGAK